MTHALKRGNQLAVQLQATSFLDVWLPKRLQYLHLLVNLRKSHFPENGRKAGKAEMCWNNLLDRGMIQTSGLLRTSERE